MKSILSSITILVLVFFMNACGNYNRTAAQAEVLFRGDWKLKEVQGQAVPDSSRSRFQFTPGKISGSTGCNRLSAGFVPGKDNSIKFSPEAVTTTACKDENAAALETKFLDALSKSTKWSMTSGELWLGNGETTLIKLKSMQ
jgi:heat shock protein HslJ